jgi:outer membrane receptor protein involved in Fe transport
MPALAATVGLVRGTVTLDGTPVAGAALSLVGEGSTFTTTSDSTGAYVFSDVPFGNYQLTATRGAAKRQTAILVTSDGVTDADVALTTNLKTIVVTSASSHAGPSGNPVSVGVIDKSQIAASPVQNSLDKTIETLPGILQFSYNEPVANGFHGISYQIDGAPLPLATSSNFAEVVDPRDIDSIEVFTGAIPAEYGGDRMGAVVNIISTRPSDVPEGLFGLVSGGFGTQAQSTGGLDASWRSGSTEATLNLNSNTTNRGLDAPTFNAINDNSSSSDGFFRLITQANSRATLAFDYSNQLSQFQIPINTDPNNADDPIVSVPGTLDTQLEYDRYASLSWTQTSKDGNGIVQITPWWRSTRIDYSGDLAADVLGTQPNFGCPDFPDCSVDPGYPATLNSVGLQQSTYANYIGLDASDFRATKHHAWKFGFQVSRENAVSDQTFACYYVNCDVPGPQGSGNPVVVADPYYASVTPTQSQAGAQIGLYGEDKWQPNPNLVVSYGLRYDHSTGYVGGWQLSPRVGFNLSDGGKNVLHVYYGRFYAAPQLEDVRSSCVVFSAQQACPTTNPVYDLQPETDSYYEMGIAHQFSPSLSGYANFFIKTVSNVLDTTQFLNTPLFAVYNNAIGIDHGLDLRLQDRLYNGDSWFVSGTISGSYAGGISGSTFLFPPDANGDLPLTSPAQLGVEDHDETVSSTAAYTHRFGTGKQWFATLQANYGSGFPVEFEDANENLEGRLPAHTTFDLAAGRNVRLGKGPQDQGLGFQLLVNNVLNHQYVIKVANGFNTTQIANGRTVQFRITAPF